MTTPENQPLPAPTNAIDVISQRYASGKQTCILTLTFPDLSQVGDLLKRIEYGVHCWELRGDLLSPSGAAEESNIPSAEYVQNQIQCLRSHSNLPIFFSLRMKSQGGRFPDAEIAAAAELISLAVNLKCEYVEWNINWPLDTLKRITSKPTGTKIVGSEHDGTGDLRWTDAGVRNICKSIDQYADIISVSLLASDMDDCHDLAQFTRKHRQSNKKPLLATCTGLNGQLSRIISPITQVTHPGLPFPASADQPTVAKVNQALNILGQLPKKQFYIFGHNIAHSLSPTLHNAGFQELGLPHRYRIHQSENVDKSVEDLVNRHDFGGASVTFPHKLQVGRLLDSVSPVVEKVGAVNTIVVRKSEDGSRVLIGDNTDWLGIKRCIDSASVRHLGTSAALVLGAGGAARAACYAIQSLGVQHLLIVNRTLSKAEDMAALFPDMRTTIFESLEAACEYTGPCIRVIIACVPADDLSEDKIPTKLFSGADTGALVEMAYRPQVTGMMKVAKRFPGWSVFKGIDVLEEQAYAQFELWTEMPAPSIVMGDAMRAKASGKL
ncbi:type I 3-dehydroquinase-domain-containing protein [Ilyonectria robusta]|uniref:type I 3-dehydroquinase-domain-containing protein n=1 Tax=Ilyonectria robusta TaxID=1079257 RepID=UPI001E8DFDE3|nr:type I 3-dehydroquinase-domain-containing protein [Ilyonectria robusta]KAH8738397.1 type I 3-dehydroquinase-domain-containing protein [Ilyonectria robusta]